MRLHRGCSPRATPGATDRELLPIRENVPLGPPKATKAPTPWHTRLHPDTSRSKISEQQCLAGPGSPHNDRSDGKPKFRRIPADSGGNPEFRRKSRGFRRKSEPGLPPQRQKFDKSRFDTNLTFLKFNNVCQISWFEVKRKVKPNLTQI